MAYDTGSISNVWTRITCAHVDWYNNEGKDNAEGYHSAKLLKKTKVKYVCVIGKSICKS